MATFRSKSNPLRGSQPNCAFRRGLTQSWASKTIRTETAASGNNAMLFKRSSGPWRHGADEPLVGEGGGEMLCLDFCYFAEDLPVRRFERSESLGQTSRRQRLFAAAAARTTLAVGAGAARLAAFVLFGLVGHVTSPSALLRGGPTRTKRDCDLERNG